MFEFLYSEGKFLGFYVYENKYESSFRKLPVVWSAAQSLLKAINAGYPGIPWKQQMRSLRAELDAVVRASSNDEFLCAVIDGIPEEARNRGVYPEDALKDRFNQLEKIARRVDLVPAEGAPLPIHILSYLQSLLLFKSASNISQSELNNEKTDFSKLNTDDILYRAKFWIDRGDFGQALRYMNLLKGAPRTVAREWMKEARILLETKQAVNVLMAHAAFSGLMYL